MVTLQEIVASEVEYLFDDAEEVGSSDISICISNVLDAAEQFGIKVDEYNFFGCIRGLISYALCEMEGA